MQADWEYLRESAENAVRVLHWDYDIQMAVAFNFMAIAAW